MYNVNVRITIIFILAPWNFNPRCLRPFAWGAQAMLCKTYYLYLL